MVKLADRLHNMRTLHFIKSPAKRERIARETLDIYAPLARSIGCHRICTELEELSFEHLNPVARNAIIRRLETLRTSRAGRSPWSAARSPPSWRPAACRPGSSAARRQPYSIWRKLQRKSIGFSQLSDIYAFRVIVDSEADCYRALGVIHRAWPSVPERFKDFISTPKRNNYRSLHTTVVGPKGMRIEMQIRTEAMDRVAEEGVAAHWRYKDKSYGFDAEGMEAPAAATRCQPAPARPGAGARRRRRGAGRARQARDVPRPGLRLHPQGQADQPAERGHAARLRLRGPHRHRRHHHRVPRSTAS
jgi:guanosine-3',5'-bis(diphosphate) 3'-pyrophosphohydrolase